MKVCVCVCVCVHVEYAGIIEAAIDVTGRYGFSLIFFGLVVKQSLVPVLASAEQIQAGKNKGKFRKVELR